MSIKAVMLCFILFFCISGSWHIYGKHHNDDIVANKLLKNKKEANKLLGRLSKLSWVVYHGNLNVFQDV